MNKLEPAASDQSSQRDRGPGPQSEPRNLMHNNSAFCRALCQGRILRGQQFDFITPLTQAKQSQ
jgi:hypothetical protein